MSDSRRAPTQFPYGHLTDDAGATSLPAHVYVRVNRPVAGDDFAVSHGANPVAVSVLDNDTDPDGNPHVQRAGSEALLSDPPHATETFDAATNSFGQLQLQLVCARRECCNLKLRLLIAYP